MIEETYSLESDPSHCKGRHSQLAVLNFVEEDESLREDELCIPFLMKSRSVENLRLNRDQSYPLYHAHEQQLAVQWFSLKVNKELGYLRI
jgi:hypothetical protein